MYVNKTVISIVSTGIVRSNSIGSPRMRFGKCSMLHETTNGSVKLRTVEVVPTNDHVLSFRIETLCPEAIRTFLSTAICPTIRGSLDLGEELIQKVNSVAQCSHYSLRVCLHPTSMVNRSFNFGVNSQRPFRKRLTYTCNVVIWITHYC